MYNICIQTIDGISWVMGAGGGGHFVAVAAKAAAVCGFFLVVEAARKPRSPCGTNLYGIILGYANFKNRA